MPWQKSKNILAYPHHWQQPAKTEQWAYQKCMERLKPNKFTQIICFPWATLIDLLNCKQTQQANELIQVLNTTPPKTTLIRITICQHIKMKDILPYLKQLKITDLFWSHATTQESTIAGIRIHPFPLYPVQCEHMPALKPVDQRQYRYTFIGSYDAQLYLSKVRQWLFELPQQPQVLIKRRKQWHFNALVYDQQIKQQPPDKKQQTQYQQNTQEYRQIMLETQYCLCPSGSGPNSIRLWEALGYGCVAVILSDTLKLPGDQQLWQQATIRLPETAQTIEQLPQQLNTTPTKQQHQASQTLWQRYGIDNFIYDLQNFSVTHAINISKRKLI